jgi:hypothetical protein
MHLMAASRIVVESGPCSPAAGDADHHRVKKEGQDLLSVVRRLKAIIWRSPESRT